MSQNTEVSNCYGFPFYYFKTVFCLILPFVLGYKVHGKLNTGEVSTQNSVCRRLHFCDSFISLFLPLNIFNSHTPTL